MRNLLNAIGQNWKVLSAIMAVYLATQYVPPMYHSVCDSVKQAKYSFTRSLVEDYLYDNPITVKYAPATRKEAAKIADTSTGLAGDYVYIVWELETRLQSCQGDLNTVREILGNQDYRLASMKNGDKENL